MSFFIFSPCLSLTLLSTPLKTDFRHKLKPQIFAEFVSSFGAATSVSAACGNPAKNRLVNAGFFANPVTALD